MSKRFSRYALATLIACYLVSLSSSGFGVEPVTKYSKRQPWTTSRVIGSPDPPLPYTTTRAYPNLQFNRCLDIAPLPGGDRIFVVEQNAKIFSFEDRPDVANADLAIDLSKEIPGVKQAYAIEFHPDFTNNRYCYICYIRDPNLSDGTHVARFRVTDTNPPMIDASSETTIITWLSGGHNGCCLKFGPDGYLYISTGDGAGPNPPDPNRVGQDISELLSSILRIDVDRREAGRNYLIPKDNPFVEHSGARGEVWAFGLRNPWRMSFDKKTGDLWVGDVGWELWESMIRVERGGNYGWSVMEARQPINPDWSRGPAPIRAPEIAHLHTESSSITDGLTYYGNRLPELAGMHIYGDYDTGKLWSFRYENGLISEHREIADTSHRIVGFGIDHAGELLIIDHIAGTFHRLSPNPGQSQHDRFPRRISQSGLFASLSRDLLQPAEGVVSYTINSELWSDHATAERHIGLPEDSAVDPSGAAWRFPTDTVLAKTLSIEMVRGDASSRKRIETQILHFNGQDWLPYTYHWNDQQTDAELVNALGDEVTLEIRDAQAPDGIRKQSWRFAGRGECQRCHNLRSGPALAFNVHQLNRTIKFQEQTDNQLDALSEMGVLERPLKDKERTLVANLNDHSQDLESRARSYLHSNCAHCHRMHAGGSVLSKMQFDLPIDKTDMLGALPNQGTFGIAGARVIEPGDPHRSVLLYRMAKLGGGRMPHIGSNEVDLEGLELLERWIQGMPKRAESDRDESIEKSSAAESDWLSQLRSTSDGAECSALIAKLLSTPTGAFKLCRSIDRNELATSTKRMAIEQASKHSDISIRELFERFLSAEKRVKRLGSYVNPDQILALRGDASAGRELFFDSASMTCKNCHQIRGQGTAVGPDLSSIGQKYNRAQILENILEPSKVIEPKFATVQIETDAGQVLTGILVRKEEKITLLQDAQNRVTEIPNDEIVRTVTQRQSLMPDGLFREMTAQQLADLLEYLHSQK